MLYTRNCEWLIKSVIIYLIVSLTWITVGKLELIHAGSRDFCGYDAFIRYKANRWGNSAQKLIHNNFANRTALR